MLFFDFEVNYRTKTIDQIGAIYVNKNGSKEEFLPATSKQGFVEFIKKHQPQYFIGHNIADFDMSFIKNSIIEDYINKDDIIDTLYLSTLLYPRKLFHGLIKDDKLCPVDSNNPFFDSQKARQVFDICVNTFKSLPQNFQDLLYLLLRNREGLKPFFKYIKFVFKQDNLYSVINKLFSGKICLNKPLDDYINEDPLILAYALMYVYAKEEELAIITDYKNNYNNYLLPPWVLNKFSKVEEILLSLRYKHCGDQTCLYCNSRLAGLPALKRYFDYEKFKDFEGLNLQESAVKKAIQGKSLIAVFPTGGGKSLAFQLPALLAGETIGGLTVVISPLQSLMKDQVDSLRERNINKADYINGLLSRIEHKAALDNVINGKTNILYLSPESLRRRTIFNLLLKRQVVRFVIDEAHCFSTWGHDFRPDYLYIGDFIKLLQTKKKLDSPIPISCFTATAKQNVIDDIKNYFLEKLNLELTEIKTTAGRTNLDYQVIYVEDDEERFKRLRNLLEMDSRPTIIYTSRTKTVDDLHKRLAISGFKVSKFHGTMPIEDKLKNQEEFMQDKTNIMIATNAFGMGVDKNDVAVVIHYHISDSLENYIQEAGRAGRNPNLKAQCYILYNEEDLNAHFQLLNSSKVTNKEINQVWRAIKKNVKVSEKISKTPFELGYIAGWDRTVYDMETRVKTSILALEDSNFIKREFDSPRVLASSLNVSNMIKASKIIDESSLIPEEKKITTKRIISYLISQQKRSWSLEYAESRVDNIADSLGLTKEEVSEHINYLIELNILADEEDLTAKYEQSLTSYLTKLNRYREILNNLLDSFSLTKSSYNLKKLNEDCHSKYQANIDNLIKGLNYLEISNYIKLNKNYRDYLEVNLTCEKVDLIAKLNHILSISEFIIRYLNFKIINFKEQFKHKIVGFSIIELKKKYLESLGLVKEEVSNEEIKEALLLLQRLDILKIDGGFVVLYLPMTIERLEQNNYRSYTIREYKKLSNHYKTKNEQIHIVGRYVELMNQNKIQANEFVSDYFNMPYQDFLNKHFPGLKRKELNLKMTKSRYQKLFGTLSFEQKEIIEDDQSRIIGVAAGPGSGKTTLLVHKLASIIHNEDIRYDQLLMLTFSRAAVLEFKSRLKELIGSVANYIYITTFHSFAFDILGRPGTIDESNNIIKDALKLIRSKEANIAKITKMVLVIDEAQDMSQDEYDLVCELIGFNENLRVIAVGDDDQNIYEFRGSNSKYLKEFSKHKLYELTTNYRSKNNIVNYTSKFISQISDRLKTKPLKSYTNENGILEVVTYKTNNIIQPLIEQVVKRPPGRTAIITRTNEEAELISGILNEYQIVNKFITDNRDVKLFNIYELRCFYDYLAKKTNNIISKSIWNEAIEYFKKHFSNSMNYKDYQKLLNKFFEYYENPYLYDLKEYLIELDASYFTNEERLVVTNIHKVKGMQFDNVYMLYNYPYKIEKQEDLRAIYVGLTRAKNYLSIHTNNYVFSKIKSENVVYLENNIEYKQINTIQIDLTLEDINLGFYQFINKDLQGILPGDTLEINLKNDMVFYKKRLIEKLSKQGKQIIREWYQKGYHLTSASVNNLVYWFDKEADREVLIALPKLTLKYKEQQNS